MKKIEVVQTEAGNTVTLKKEQGYTDKNIIHPYLSMNFERHPVILNSSTEVDEFCELLQNKKSEIWPESIKDNPYGLYVVGVDLP